MSKCLICLKSLPIFEDLDTETFKSVCLNASKNILKKGEYLVHIGQPSDSIYLIKEGSLKLIQHTNDGKEIIIDVIGRGQVIGETALFKKQIHFFDVVALEPVKVCSFSLSQFEYLIENNSQFAMKIISSLGKKLYATMHQMGDVANHSVENKLIALLFRLAKDYGEDTNVGKIIKINLTHENLANMIGCSRVMVTQVLKQFKTQGIIKKQGKYYVHVDQCLIKNFPK